MTTLPQFSYCVFWQTVGCVRILGRPKINQKVSNLKNIYSLKFNKEI